MLWSPTLGISKVGPGVGGEDHRPEPDISRGTVVMKNIFLIGYTHTNTNIGHLRKLFLWFRLVINPFDIRFRSLVSPIPNSLRPNGTFFQDRIGYTNSQGRPWELVYTSSILC
ncbi:hypothetical protein Hanom_Chr11g01044241 [Helianthus anomalus]